MARGFFGATKQAMEMRNRLRAMQKELEKQISEYENGGVKVHVSGDMIVQCITIDPEIIDITRVERLERTVMENVNKALRLAKDSSAKSMGTLAKAMGLDGLAGAGL